MLRIVTTGIAVLATILGAASAQAHETISWAVDEIASAIIDAYMECPEECRGDIQRETHEFATAIHEVYSIQHDGWRRNYDITPMGKYALEEKMERSIQIINPFTRSLRAHIKECASAAEIWFESTASLLALRRSPDYSRDKSYNAEIANYRYHGEFLEFFLLFLGFEDDVFD